MRQIMMVGALAILIGMVGAEVFGQTNTRPARPTTGPATGPATTRASAATRKTDRIARPDRTDKVDKTEAAPEAEAKYKKVTPEEMADELTEARSDADEVAKVRKFTFKEIETDH